MENCRIGSLECPFDPEKMPSREQDMPRANRNFQPGQVWHLTHRCHKKEFLLRYVRDRQCWLRWLYEARKRFGLCLLNYTATSNHIHALVLDRGKGEISRGMQLAAARTAQQYNRRRGRTGAFWEDRFHATAVQTDSHLHRCLVYIDLNMVRAGMVTHPAQWPHGGYREIQNPPQRYRLIDQRALTGLCGLASAEELRRAHRDWVESALAESHLRREPCWTEARAVGTAEFVDRFTPGD